MGYENVVGYLEGGLETWKAAGKPLEQFKAIEPEEFAKKYKAGEKLKIVDVRKKNDWDARHFDGAHHLELSVMEK